MIDQWPSPGKLNLFLYIVGRRIDGYHYLQTLFQFIDYGDIITILVTKSEKIRLFTNTNNIIFCDNLIIRAAKLLQKYCFINKKKIGADIFLKKVLPIGSGLGGFSSNAATVLMVLNQKWNCYLNYQTLIKLGMQLGADVPIFIYGKSSFAEGIGNIFISNFICKKWYLIIMPDININTAWIFNKYDQLNTFYSPYRTKQKLFRIPFSNDLEWIVKKMFPDLKKYFKYLSQYSSVQLTGSGSCIFSEFNDEYTALQVQRCLPSFFKSVVVSSKYISPLHQKLFQYNML